MPYAQGVRKILPDPHMGFYCVQTAVWLVYHNISYYIRNSVNFPNFRTGQYFPNTLYILMYVCISMYMHYAFLIYLYVASKSYLELYCLTSIYSQRCSLYDPSPNNRCIKIVYKKCIE